jgi:tetratricopeptide (TPR) repeat protein
MPTARENQPGDRARTEAGQEIGLWFPILAGEYGWRVNPQEASSCSWRTLAWLQPEEMNYSLHSFLQALAGLYTKVGEFDLAKSQLNQAIEICKRMGDRVNQAENYHNLVNLLFQERSYEEARVFVQKRLEIYEELGDQAKALFALDQIGRLDLALGEFQQAKNLYHIAIEHSRQFGLRHVEAAFLSWQSIACQRAGIWRRPPAAPESLAIHAS